MKFLVANTILQWKEPGVLGEMADLNTGAGNTQDEPGTLIAPDMKVVLKN